MEKPIEDYTREELLELIGREPEGWHIDEWLPRDNTWHQERLNWISELESLRSYVKDLEAEYLKSNNMLRSSFAIAERDGEKTNWEVFKNNISAQLERDHAFLKPLYESKAAMAILFPGAGV